MNTTQLQIIKEQRNISKYAGLLCSRIMLLASFFILFIVLKPTSFYFFIFLLFCPCFLSIYLEKRQKSPEITLNFCAKKYFYTPVRLTIERFMGNSTVILLSFWQLTLAPKATSLLSLYMAPGILLLLYLICRILATAIVRQKIHRLYMELILLD